MRGRRERWTGGGGALGRGIEQDREFTSEVAIANAIAFSRDHRGWVGTAGAGGEKLNISSWTPRRGVPTFVGGGGG